MGQEGGQVGRPERAREAKPPRLPYETEKKTERLLYKASRHRHETTESNRHEPPPARQTLIERAFPLRLVFQTHGLLLLRHFYSCSHAEFRSIRVPRVQLRQKSFKAVSLAYAESSSSSLSASFAL
jgi:hypothetical protein